MKITQHACTGFLFNSMPVHQHTAMGAVVDAGHAAGAVVANAGLPVLQLDVVSRANPHTDSAADTGSFINRNRKPFHAYAFYKITGHHPAQKRGLPC